MKEKLFEYVRFLVGTVMFFAALAVHAWLKELPSIVFLITLAFAGLDIPKIFDLLSKNHNEKK